MYILNECTLSTFTNQNFTFGHLNRDAYECVEIIIN